MRKGGHHHPHTNPHPLPVPHSHYHKLPIGKRALSGEPASRKKSEREQFPPYSLIIANKSPHQSPEIHDRLTENGFTCRFASLDGDGKVKCIFSFDDLTSLVSAHHTLTTRWSYVASISTTSIPKTYVLDKTISGGYPFASPNSKIIYVFKLDQIEPACATLVRESKLDTHGGPGILGLDCEWKPEFVSGQKNPIAVLQLSSGYSTAIFHLTLLRQQLDKKFILPAPLKNILLQTDIAKVVIGNDDTRRILDEYNIVTASEINLQKLPIAHRFSGVGLATMAGLFLKVQVSKKMQMTDWSRVLTQKQIEYAALDAELTHKIYFKIKNLLLD